MKKLSYLLIAITLILASCDSNSVYREFEKTDNLEWKKNDIKTFKFENKDDTSSFDVIFAFRYARNFQFKEMKVGILETTPSAEQLIPLNFEVIGSDGKYIGDGSGDIWDLEIPIKSNVSLEKGEYKYQLSHLMPIDPVHMIMEIGIIIRKAE